MVSSDLTEANCRCIQPSENGMRTDGSAGTYEWWYFDAILHDGSKLFVIFYTKSTKKIESELNPYLSFTLYSPDGIERKWFYYSSEKEYFFAKERCEIRIGPNEWKGDLTHYQINIQIDDLSAQISLIRNNALWKPNNHVISFNESDYFAWLPAVPSGRVDCVIKIGEHEQRYDGNGYHDHNWGLGWMNTFINKWYWVRINIQGYTFIAAYITQQVDFPERTVTFFMLAKDGKIRADDERNVVFYEKDLFVDPTTRVKCGNTLVFEYKDHGQRYAITLKRQKDLVAKISSSGDQRYLRFGGSVEIYDSIEGRDFCGIDAVWEIVSFDSKKKSGK